MTDKQKQIAVLTGDLVDSTGLGPEKIARAFKALEDCARIQEDWHGAPLHFTRHRGDGWQVVLARPEMALRSALAFRASLRAADKQLDSYIAIAEGHAPKIIVSDLNQHSEDVFVTSGLGLDELKDVPLPYRLCHLTDGRYDATTILADAISQSWTSPQAAAILLAIAPNKYVTDTAIGKSLSKSRQAVSKALRSAQYEFLRLALDRLEHEFKND